LILVFYRRYQNDSRETSPGKTSHIDDVINLGMTGFYYKRPILGTKGFGKEFKYEEFRSCRSSGVQEPQIDSAGPRSYQRMKYAFFLLFFTPPQPELLHP
jgi:hypothetical protein